jgi:uncharacterized protein (TIRG00374 family)
MNTNIDNPSRLSSKMNATAKPRLTKRVYLFVAIGLIVFILYLYFFIGATNIAEVIDQTNLYYYSLAFFTFIASLLFYSLAWHSLLHNLNVDTKIRKVLLYSWAGMFFDAVAPDPGWSGDISKAYMLSKDSGQDPGRIMASVVGQKIITTAATAISLVLGLILLGSDYALSNDIIAFIAVTLALTVAALVTIIYFSTNDRATGGMLNWLIRAACFIRRGKWNPENFRSNAFQTLKKFHEGIRTLSANPKALIRPVSLSFLSWGFDLSIIFLAFASIGYPVTPEKVLIVYALTGSLQAFGASFLGFTEIVVSGSYTILGIPIAISVSATLLTRIVTLWFKLVISYAVFQYAGINLLLGRKKEPEAKTSSPLD